MGVEPITIESTRTGTTAVIPQLTPGAIFSICLNDEEDFTIYVLTKEGTIRKATTDEIDYIVEDVTTLH